MHADTTATVLMNEQTPGLHGAVVGVVVVVVLALLVVGSLVLIIMILTLKLRRSKQLSFRIYFHDLII